MLIKFPVAMETVMPSPLGETLCIVCHKNFSSEKNLLLHVRRVHLKEIRHHCDQCNYACFDRCQLKRHQCKLPKEAPTPQRSPDRAAPSGAEHLKRRHSASSDQPTKAPRKQCFLCQFTCTGENELKEHILSHQGDQAFKCQLCSFSSNYKEPLERHLKSSHPPRKPPTAEEGCENSIPSVEDRVGFECELCHFRSMTQKEAASHALTAHKPTGAGSESQKEDALVGESSEIMMWKETGTKRIKYHCVTCPFSSRSWKKLLDHHRVHTGEKPYRCLVCPFLARTKSLLKAHVRKAHPGEAKKSWSCPECKFETRHYPAWRNHCRTHAGDNFKCHLCPFYGMNNKSLQAHKRSHQEEFLA